MRDESAREADLLDDFYSLDAAPPNGVPVPVDSASERFEERRRWTATTLPALGVSTFACVLFAVGASRWSVWSDGVRTAFLLAATLSAHFGGLFVERRGGEPALARFLHFIGTTTFVVGGAVLGLGLGSDAAPTFERCAATFPFVAAIAFATAQTSVSRSLHFLAALAFLGALALDGESPNVARWTLVCCALGEYWARRFRSRRVATVYCGVCAWALVEATFSPLPSSAATAAIVGVLGLFGRWFSATFRSVLGAAVGTFVALGALGSASFLGVWRSTFPSEGGAAVAAAICAAAFVFFSVRQLLDGARRDAVRFATALVFAACWTLAQGAVVATTFAENRWTLVPVSVAALVFASLAVESRARFSVVRRSRETEIDVPSDDPEFDDAFDAEARAGAKTPPLSPLSETLDEFCAAFAIRSRFPAFVASLAAQLAALGFGGAIF
ncbi:MAG: hypothetical protein IKU86_02070 [Thermoguttaceae bacterium]|nr:hypothetical protein [Thermoguttaceae bacterium]